MCLGRMGMADLAKSNFAVRFADPPAELRILKIIHNWLDQPKSQEKLIRQLLNQGFGGVVIALGALPLNSAAKFPSPKTEALGRDLFGSTKNAVAVTRHGVDGAGVFLPAGSAGSLPLVLAGVLDREVTVHAARSPVRVTHRRIDGSEVYFLIKDSNKSWQGDRSLSARGSGELWYPARRAVTQTNLGTGVSLNLEPYGAALLSVR